MASTQTAKPTTVVVWTRLRPGEKRILETLSEQRGVPQGWLLGSAVRQWLKRHKVPKFDSKAALTGGRVTKGSKRRDDVTWARMMRTDKEAMTILATKSGQSECLLVRRAFVWWVQQGAPE